MIFKDNSYKLTILGCGTLGGAVLNSILALDESLIPSKIFAITKSESSRANLLSVYGDKIEASTDAAKAVRQSDVVVVGLKPFYTKEVLDTVKDELKGKLIISLVAGWTLEQFEEYSDKVARVMTNTPAKYGKGMAAISLSKSIDASTQEGIEKLMSKIGSVIIIPDSKMDAATSLIGSGPAFVLLIMEAMIDGGVKLGFSYEESRKSVLQVMEGTVAMADTTKLHPAVLKSQVCTPGGTTINGLAVMEDKNLRSAIIQGIQKAKDIATEMGKK